MLCFTKVQGKRMKKVLAIIISIFFIQGCDKAVDSESVNDNEIYAWVNYLSEKEGESTLSVEFTKGIQSGIIPLGNIQLSPSEEITVELNDEIYVLQEQMSDTRDVYYNYSFTNTVDHSMFLLKYKRSSGNILTTSSRIPNTLQITSPSSDQAVAIDSTILFEWETTSDFDHSDSISPSVRIFCEERAASLFHIYSLDDRENWNNDNSISIPVENVAALIDDIDSNDNCVIRLKIINSTSSAPFPGFIGGSIHSSLSRIRILTLNI